MVGYPPAAKLLSSSALLPILTFFLAALEKDITNSQICFFERLLLPRALNLLFAILLERAFLFLGTYVALIRWANSCKLTLKIDFLA